MKKLILIFSIFLLISCEDPKQVYESEIKTYVISSKDSYYLRPQTYYTLYFQTPISTEKANITSDTYNKYKIGDTIHVLIKYWEKPKKK